MSMNAFVLVFFMIAIGLVFVVVNVVRHLRFVAVGSIGRVNALKNMKSLRLDKMDKESVMVVAPLKSGSTFLCYICSLLNTENKINNFRNDFDILPMLSFAQSKKIFQNFNARQDGKYQMYKINGSLRHVEDVIRATGAQRIIWCCRDFGGWYRSVYWWMQEFHPKKYWKCFYFNLIGWDLFKRVTLETMAREHVEELWYGYHRVIAPDVRDLVGFSYDHITKEKVRELKSLASWLEIEINDEMIRSISEKTSKEAMSIGDRFDPINYGEGGGLNKVNIEPHSHKLNDEDLKLYSSIFEARFKPIGINSYSQLIDEMRERQLKKFGRSSASMTAATREAGSVPS